MSFVFFFASRRRHTRWNCDWSADVCSSDLGAGLELVRHIAGLGTDLPVAVITAHGSAENAVAALKAGAFDYVSKPVGLEQLRALVKSALSLPDSASAPA